MSLVTVNVSLAGVGAITGDRNNFFLRKMKKHERLPKIGSNVLGQINKTLSESFIDDHISDDQEFKKMLEE